MMGGWSGVKDIAKNLAEKAWNELTAPFTKPIETAGHIIGSPDLYTVGTELGKEYVRQELTDDAINAAISATVPGMPVRPQAGAAAAQPAALPPVASAGSAMIQTQVTPKAGNPLPLLALAAFLFS
jgi:hypothetical protein